MNWSEFIKNLFEEAKPFLVKRGDWDHIQVSHHFSKKLLQKEGGKSGVVEPAIILHDIGWSSLDSNDTKKAFGVKATSDEAARLNRIHEVEGVKLARKILIKYQYDQDQIEEILPIIDRHDSGETAASTEEKIVKDSDKLWRCSKLGFWHEVSRQNLKPQELYDFLYARKDRWFFTPTATELFIEELKERRQEI